MIFCCSWSMRGRLLDYGNRGRLTLLTSVRIFFFNRSGRTIHEQFVYYVRASNLRHCIRLPVTSRGRVIEYNRTEKYDAQKINADTFFLWTTLMPERNLECTSRKSLHLNRKQLKTQSVSSIKNKNFHFKHRWHHSCCIYRKLRLQLLKSALIYKRCSVLARDWWPL